MRPQLLRQRGETADVGEEDGCHGLDAAEHLLLWPRRQQAVGEIGIHVAGERRLDALLVRDVLDHHERAELGVLAREEREDRDVRRHGLPVDRELGVHRQIGRARLGDVMDTFDQPCVSAEDVFGRLPHQLFLRPAQDPAPRRVAGVGASLLVERDHAVRHALEHGGVVVLHRLDVREELRVLQRARDLRRERSQPALVLRGERAATLVQGLRDTDRPAFLVEDRHAEETAREVAALLVERGIEAQVGVGVRDTDRLSGSERRSGDPEMIRKADLRQLQLVHDVADQLAGLLVVQEQRRPIAVQHAGGLRHDAGKQRRELQLRRQIGDQIQEVDLPLALAGHPLEPLERLEADGAFASHALEQREVIRVEGVVDLVQHLCDPDRLSLCIPDGGADQRPRPVAGLLVDVAVEARIGVGVVDDLADAAVEHGPGDAEVVHEPDLSRAEAGGDVRVELARLLVVQEDRALVGADLLHCRLEQRVDDRVEGVERCHPAGERGEHLQLPKLLELLGVRGLPARGVGHRRFSSHSSRIV